MKYKLLAMLLTAVMCISPVLGFWHPPPPPPPPGPPCTYFFTMIDEVNPAYVYNFTEPADGFCDTFHVTVWIGNVTDLYGYEFKLVFDNTVFNLVSWSVNPSIWTSQAIIFNGTIAPNVYQQIVTALHPPREQPAPSH